MRAVLAESFERIHRSNLIGMGILTLELPPGASSSLAPDAVFEILGLSDALRPGASLVVRANAVELPVRVRLDSDMELATYRQGGILPLTLRELLATSRR